MDLGDIIALLVIIGIPLLRRSRSNRARKYYKNRRLPERTDTIFSKKSEPSKKISVPIFDDTPEVIEKETKKVIEPLTEKEVELKRVKQKGVKQKIPANPLEGLLNNDNIIKGIVMSEILGPPKSRK